LGTSKAAEKLESFLKFCEKLANSSSQIQGLKAFGGGKGKSVGFLKSLEHVPSGQLVLKTRLTAELEEQRGWKKDARLILLNF
jgi:hypothetical protein